MAKIILTVLAMFAVVVIDNHVFKLSNSEFWIAELVLMGLCAIFIKDEISE
jgi:hypothetical protein